MEEASDIERRTHPRPATADVCFIRGQRSFRGDLADNRLGPYPTPIGKHLGLKGDEKSPDDDDYFFPIRGNNEYELYYDIWSNIHYGYVGRAAVFPATELQVGQLFAGRTDEADVISVGLGIYLWDTYGADLSETNLHSAILETIPLWERSNARTAVLYPRDLGNWR